jgi:hypothetical protein
MEPSAVGLLVDSPLIRIIALALAASVSCGTMARAATCLSSAADVRKQQPKAWPKWTYGPQGERCWYAGEKPVFAKTTKEVRQAKAPSQPRAAPNAELPSAPPPSAEGRNNNIRPTWELEYRWPK